MHPAAAVLYTHDTAQCRGKDMHGQQPPAQGCKRMYVGDRLTSFRLRVIVSGYGVAPKTAAAVQLANI
jgi:hypothetical protein